MEFEEPNKACHTTATSPLVGGVFSWFHGFTSVSSLAVAGSGVCTLTFAKERKTGMTGQFVSDTSTLAIFDPEAIRHRIDDDGDWWTYPDDAVLSEINRGNIGIVDLGSDGGYDLRQGDEFDPQTTFQLRTPSGRIFVGAGEEISGGGLQPEAIRGGFFLALNAQAASVALRRDGRLIEYRIEPLSGTPSNTFKSWPSLKKENQSEQDGSGNGG